MKKTALILVLMVAGLFVACDSTQNVTDVVGNVQLSGTYDVTAIDGNQVPANKQSLTFNALDTSINGNGGCNTFFGDYTLNAGNLSFAELATTKKMCDKATMEREEALLEALNNTGSYRIYQGTLTLYGTDQSVLLSAKKRAQNEE
ncbi:META domain-containing protein [Luteirhabdus pelagi]|uniref:META domain-containing protein n=1 Tax=Luteirhabdus pelagi TaxID=2792783 RepID=UPI00193AC404|nr:META domain-containing protein [Luteirhabdus pelagi]